MCENNMEKVIRVGSRKSELALIQTKHVISCLQKLYPERKFEIHTMSTLGDRTLNVSLPKIGEKSLFTKDLEDALRTGGVDFVVHSLKDLPTSLPLGMAIGAVLEREDPRDALVLNGKYSGKTLDTLPAGSIIGTSSLRRTAQLRRLYSHLEVCDIRGNLNTRLAKLDSATSKFAGIILARAGLVRMGWKDRISQVLEPTDILFAVGQGALAVECRSNDEIILTMLQNLMCLSTACEILTERSFLKTLGGGCSAPVAVHTKLKRAAISGDGNESYNIEISGAVWSLDGKTEIKDNNTCCLENLLNRDHENEDSNDGVTPRKRIKLSENNHIEESNDIDRKQDSPEIIQESESDEVATNGGGGDAPQNTLQYLINIHGKILQRCPFYNQHQEDKQNGNSSPEDSIKECPLDIPVDQNFMGICPYVTNIEEKNNLIEKFNATCPYTGKTASEAESMMEAQAKSKCACPIKMPIGQDVMGECPALSTTDKVILTEEFSNVCPITGKTIEINRNGTNTPNHQNSESKVISNNNNNCPFLAITSNTESCPYLASTSKTENCPFLKKNPTAIKMIDRDETKFFLTEAPPNLIDNSDELFCGLYRHKCYNINMFAKCQELGANLASKLISNGALDVMKCAQKQIRDQV